MFQGLMELMILVAGLYLIWRLTKRAWDRADVKRKMEQIKTAENIASEIERFRKNHRKVAYNMTDKEIRDFLDEK